MKYQRALHDAFAGKAVPAGVRRAAQYVAQLADEEIAGLHTDLTVAAETLRRYEAMHRAKNTAESTDKAEANRLLAERLEAAIRSAQ